MRFLLYTVLLASTLATLYAEPTMDIYLINITIYQSHETNGLFRTNHPEVYLSCDDGEGKVDLNDVRRVKQLYQYRLGDIHATKIFPGGCVKCKLRESDASAILEDDTFGSWNMCEGDFGQDGFFEILDPGEFDIVFQCPSCQIAQPPASEPAEDEAPPSSEPEFSEVSPASAPDADASAPDSSSAAYYEDEIREGIDSTYYAFPNPDDGTNRSSIPEETSVRLQNEERDSEDKEDDLGASDGGSSSEGPTIAAVLSLCFTFLVIGVVVGVLLFWRTTALMKENPRNREIIELAKIGFSIKTANK